MNGISISVIVPVYNVELYLRDCLDSLAVQTEPFYEIILVNDGSTDYSRQICEEYCNKYKNIMFLQQDNQGLSSARNLGLKFASGDYIVFVDSDDYVIRDMNEIIHKSLLENDLDILYYNADVIDEVGGTYSERLIRSEYLDGYIMSGIEFLEKCFPDNYMTSSCLAAFKKSFLDKHKLAFPCGLYYEDNLFFMQTALRAQKILCLPNCFYIRRLRNNSIMTGKMSRKKCLDHIAVNMLIWKELYDYEDKYKFQQFYKKYISVRLIFTFLFINDFEGDTVVCDKMQTMMEFFIERWLPVYDLNSLSWDEACALRLVSRFLSDTGGENNVNNQLKYTLLNKAIDRMLMEKLGTLPLADAGRNVGIYGIGKHTQCLLEMYQRYVGKIECKLFFIVSEKKQDTYMGKQVRSCTEVPDDADIIISSRVYEKEMIDILLKNNIKRDKIISIYNSESKSMVDLIGLAEVDREHYKKEV